MRRSAVTLEFGVTRVLSEAAVPILVVSLGNGRGSGAALSESDRSSRLKTSS